MRRLSFISVVLIAASSASAIGIGFGAGYSLAIPSGDFGNAADASFAGFYADVELAIIPFFNTAVNVSYHSFDGGGVVPVTIRPELHIQFGSIDVYGRFGMGINFYTGGVWPTKHIGFCFGGGFYYMFTNRLGAGLGVDYNIYGDFTEESTKTSYIEIPIGIKYWLI
ncbi:MAG: hypothetical protein JSW52_10535 [Candidatus Coatesbacteria bacterium]|nr:MAG: hypothetical protein JSW52_10535 [Candidatus Coatesbacteria bacterium]